MPRPAPLAVALMTHPRMPHHVQVLEQLSPRLHRDPDTPFAVPPCNRSARREGERTHGGSPIRRKKRVIHHDPPLLTQSIAQRLGRPTGKTVAVSTSEADDPATRGLSPFHQRDLVVELARHLFAVEARIAYGGDFRNAGFTELLVEVQRAHARSTGTAPPRIISYLLEPLPTKLRADYVDAVRFVDVRFIGIEHAADHSAAAKARSQAKSLRAMRGEIARDVVALVAVGGRTSGYTGWRPGVAEEIAAAVAAGKPIYLVGGFGGSAGWYANAAFLGCEIPDAPAPPELGAEITGGLALPSVDEIVRALRGRLSQNGLTKAENSRLARTVDANEIVALVLSGLAKISK